MVLIRVKKSKDFTIPIYVLYRMVLRSIYAPETMPVNDLHLMSESLLEYRRNFDYARDNGIMFSAVEEEIEFTLNYLEELIKKDASGQLEQRKQTFKEKNIDWQKFHRLPEAYKAEDFIKGQEALEQHMRDFPEDYR